MSLCRAFLLWMLMLALPLQGYAAATMAFHSAPSAAAAARMAHAGPHEQAQHDHAQHEHSQHAGHAQHAAYGDHGQHDAGAAQPADANDNTHQCGSCSVCHSAAMLSELLPSAFHPLPQTAVAGRVAPLASLPARVPDKPPRA